MGFFHLFLLLPTFFPLCIRSSPLFQAATHQDPKSYYNCTSNGTFAPNSAYYSNIKTLLDWLSSNGTNNARFYNATVATKNTVDTLYGIFYCKRDATTKMCQECVIEASKLILLLCSKAKEAIIWYRVCFVRYSDRYFFSTVEESPKISSMNLQDYVGQVGRFNNILWDMMNDLRTGAAGASNKLADKKMNITGNQTLYGSAFCLPYLSSENCSWCLSDAIADIPTSCCRGKSGGTVLCPSCGVRYELFPFYQTVAWGMPPPPMPTSPHLQAPTGFAAIFTLCLHFFLALLSFITRVTQEW